MTREHLLQMVRRMNDVAELPAHTRYYIEAIAEMAHSDGIAEGRKQGLEEAHKVVTGAA